MKRILLILVFSVSTAMVAHSQLLVNTSWTCYTSGGTFLAYFHFGQDTSFYSLNGTTYSPYSVYHQTGNSIKVVDLPGIGSCLTTDTGTYTVSIHFDTLRFILVNDPCVSRAATIPTYYFISIITGIKNLNSLSSVRVFPNPSANGIFTVNTGDDSSKPEWISVNSMEGKNVFEEYFTTVEKYHSINLCLFPPGVYFLTVGNRTGKKVFRIVNSHE